MAWLFVGLSQKRGFGCWGLLPLATFFRLQALLGRRLHEDPFQLEFWVSQPATESAVPRVISE